MALNLTGNLRYRLRREQQGTIPGSHVYVKVLQQEFFEIGPNLEVTHIWKDVPTEGGEQNDNGTN